MIQGTTIQLVDKARVDSDPFGAPICSESLIEVDNVLVAQPVPSQINDMLNLYGKRLAYSIGIPKGDTHTWKEQDVIIFGERYHVFTEVTKGIEANVPGPWHHVYGVERYE